MTGEMDRVPCASCRQRARPGWLLGAISLYGSCFLSGIGITVVDDTRIYAARDDMAHADALVRFALAFAALNVRGRAMTIVGGLWHLPPTKCAATELRCYGIRAVWAGSKYQRCPNLFMRRSVVLGFLQWGRAPKLLFACAKAERKVTVCPGYISSRPHCVLQTRLSGSEPSSLQCDEASVLVLTGGQ
jgi:hypothetical protein